MKEKIVRIQLVTVEKNYQLITPIITIKHNRLITSSMAALNSNGKTRLVIL